MSQTKERFRLIEFAIDIILSRPRLFLKYIFETMRCRFEHGGFLLFRFDFRIKVSY